MKSTLLTAFIAFFAVIHHTEAAMFFIDISPVGGALNLGATPYTQDHAVGLSALNADAQPASSATGNEIGAGILFDDVSKILTFEFAYGSQFGFDDLAGDWSNTHAHGAVAVSFPAANSGAGIIPGQTLTTAHNPVTPRSGSFSGSWTLLPVVEQALFDNQIYINIHSAFESSGEIRGQLVPVGIVPEPSTLALISTSLAVLFVLRKRRDR